MQKYIFSFIGILNLLEVLFVQHIWKVRMLISCHLIYIKENKNIYICNRYRYRIFFRLYRTINVVSYHWVRHNTFTKMNGSQSRPSLQPARQECLRVYICVCFEKQWNACVCVVSVKRPTRNFTDSICVRSVQQQRTTGTSHCATTDKRSPYLYA